MKKLIIITGVSGTGKTSYETLKRNSIELGTVININDITNVNIEELIKLLVS